MAEIGIDLGTTTSGIAVLRGKPEVIEVRGHQMIPSVVAWDPESNELLVGKAAKDQAMILPSVMSVKRSMGSDKTFKLGDREYSAPEISAMILRELKKVAEATLGETADNAVITIPAYFNEAQNEATKKAGELAGFKSVRLLAEPIAAALAYGAEETVLVYDLGGGTFDVAIINCFDYTMLGLDGDPWLGGDDFDARLMARLAREISEKAGVDLDSSPQHKQMAKLECERAKIELTEKEHAQIRFQTVINDKLVNISLRISRDEFEAMIMELVDRSIDKVRSAIAKAQEKDPAFTKESIDTVLLVGASTYVPLVQRKVAEFFGKEASKRVNPGLAVTLGAAVHTASGPTQGHRIRLDPVALETANAECVVKGRTSAGARVEVTGGVAPVGCQADADGKFALTIELVRDKINEIVVVARDLNGEERKSGFSVRHDSKFTGKEQKPRKAGNVGGGLLARTLGIAVTGDDYRLGVIIPSQTQLPHSVETREYCVVSVNPGTPGSCPLEIYEGDIPYAPLNTLLWTGRLQTSAGGSGAEPLEITFLVNEERLLVVTARLVNFPDREVRAEVKCQSPTGAQLHVIERTDRILNQLGDSLRPEEKARLNKAKQGLLDLCEQYKRTPDKEGLSRIKSIGLQLRADLDKIEAPY